jgi:hypothetical protein
VQLLLIQATGLRISQTRILLVLVIVGTPSYFYAVAETVDGFYTTIKDQSDGFIKYAQLDPSTGELVPSKFIVGRDDPVENKVPERVLEEPNVIEKKCLKNPFCSWKRNHDGVSGSAPSGQYRNLVIPFKFADHSDRDLNIDALEDLFNGDHLSVKDYFETQSYNKITKVNELARETVIGRTESYCADNASGLTLVVHECLAVALAGKQTDGYDTITFVHSGYGAEYGNQDQYDTYFDDRLWSHPGQSTLQNTREGIHSFRLFLAWTTQESNVLALPSMRLLKQWELRRNTANIPDTDLDITTLWQTHGDLMVPFITVDP